MKQEEHIHVLIPVVEELETGFRLKEGFLDIVKIATQDFSGKSQDEIEYDMLIWAKFFKTYEDDVKIISLNFPVDTWAQQRFLQYKISITQNQVYLEHLQIRLNELQHITKNRTDKEFYLFCFSSDKERATSNFNRILTLLGGAYLVEELTQKKKKQILWKLNNINTCITE